MMDIEEIGRIIIDSAIQVHRTVGPGLLESAYQKCLLHALTKRGLKVGCEVLLPIDYDGVMIESGYRIDMLVNESIIIENKTVDNLLPIHEAQLLTYMRLSKIRLGFLLNWKVVLMKQGIKRMIL
jgi:GxxExxY protein